MIPFANKDKFDIDSVDKQFVITVVDTGEVIDNTILYENNFTLQQSIFSGNVIKFGGCEAAMVKFRIRSVLPYITGKTIDVKMYVDHDKSNMLSVGRFIVDTDVYTDNRLYRDITAYDFLYSKLNTDITDWYNSLKFPLTQYSMRRALAYQFNIAQMPTTLIFDDININKKEIDSLTIRDLLLDMCELNGVFGASDNYGNLKYVSLNDNRYEVKGQISVQYEDVYSARIIKATLCDADQKGTAMIDDGNEYVIQNNLLLTGKKSAELQTMAQTFLNQVTNVYYKIVKRLSVKGNPCMEVGDAITFKHNGVNFVTYILERNLNGIQSMKDDIKAEGQLYQPQVDTTYVAKEKNKTYTNLKIRWVSDESQVGSDPYTLYCIAK